ncbi:CoA transferase [Pontivivens nitratireducens]|nr:CoA transferase [Pontibrevibacter nitratireducens]
MTGECDILVENRPGYDAVFQGMCDLMNVTGISEGEPARAL